MKKRKAGKNLLEMIPKRKEQIVWTEEKTEMVVLELEHRGFYAVIAQSCFHRPRVSKIHLDALGSYIWKQIDGRRNLQDIACSLKKQFGKQAEPLYDRFIAFIQILLRHGFIKLEGSRTTV